ncbi:glycosyltransferase family 87 protein [Floridanema aerugineum]|uniref:Glycosyltransferase family 87 protein n=1 Tax=Floridaenema aerugineum BLCC-F46 TaxID=3153654 RepID=A0ABV4WXJ9_9CYAN
MKEILIFLGLIIGTLVLNRIGIKVLKQRWNLWLGYGIPACLIMLFMWNVSDPKPPFGDFTKAYYPAGRWVLENPLSLYKGKGFNGFVNIPIIAHLFTPLALLDKFNAEMAMLLLGIVVMIATYYYLVKQTGITGWKKIVLLGIFAINGPLYYSLKQGNTTHFMLLPLLAAVFLLAEKREFWAGVLLAIASLIKLPLLLFGGYLLARQKWQALAGFTGTILAVVGASILIFGVNLHTVWYQECVLPYIGKPISRYNVQSVDSFLIRLVASPSVLGTGTPIEVDWPFKVVRYLLLALLIGGSIWICWRSKQPLTPETANLEFCIVLCLAIIISPISWTHYYVLLLVPLSLYVCDRLPIPQNRLWLALMGIATILVSLPVKGAGGSNNPVFRFFVSRIFISHYFFGGVLLLGILLAARWYNSCRFQLDKASINAEVNMAYHQL